MMGKGGPPGSLGPVGATGPAGPIGLPVSGYYTTLCHSYSSHMSPIVSVSTDIIVPLSLYSTVPEIIMYRFHFAERALIQYKCTLLKSLYRLVTTVHE